MPLYNYACRTCDHEFSKKSMIDDRKIPTESPCEKCGGEIYQLLGAPKICYSMTTRRTDDDFNDKLKQLRDRVPEQYKVNLERNIR